MAKLTLTDPSAGYNSTTVIAANNTLVEAAVENTLSRDGTAPNQMEANVDMNSNRITNLTDGVNNQDAVTVFQLTNGVAGSLSGFSDVGDGTPTNQYFLIGDGDSWESRALVADDIDAESSTDGYVLTSDGAGNTAWESIPSSFTLTVEDEGTPLATGATTIDFVGTGVTATGAAAEKTITIPGETYTALADQAATTTNPIDVSSEVISLDIEALTTIESSALAATDTVYVEDGGVSKGIEVQALGLRVQTGQTTQTLAAADMNSIMEFTGTATLTLPLNSSTALPIGVPVVLNVKHATQVLTVTAATSVTLVTTNHPAGGSAASDSVDAGGTAILFKTAADVWVLSGDISD